MEIADFRYTKGNVFALWPWMNKSDLRDCLNKIIATNRKIDIENAKKLKTIRPIELEKLKDQMGL